MDNAMKALHELENLVARIRVAIEGLEEQTSNLKVEISELLHEVSQGPKEKLPIDYAILDNCYIKGSKYKSVRTRAYNVLTTNDCDDLNMLSRKTVQELLMYRNCGTCVVSLIMVLCDHYGIELKCSSLSPKVNKEIQLFFSELKKCVTFLE